MATTVKRRSSSVPKLAKKVKSVEKGKVSRKIEPHSEDELGLEKHDELDLDELDELDLEEHDGLDEDELDGDELDNDEIPLSDGDKFGEEFEDEEDKVKAETHAGESSTSQREQRLEKKRLQKERKLKKAHGAAIEEVKQLWEKLREKHGVSKDERTKLVREIMKLVDGNWKDVVFRHDSSRVVQTVFKHADKALRQEITLDLKGNYVALAKSAYGKYLLVKMMHYGSPKVRANIINEMHGSFRKMMGHKEGAYVLEDVFRDYATSKQRRLIMREFYGSEFALFMESGDSKADLADILAGTPEKRPYLLENLNRVITLAVNKGSIGFEIVHAMMLEYVRNMDRSPKSLARETFIDLIADDIVEMVHTSAGSQVASLTLAMANAKERKRLLKSLRQFPLKLAKDDNGNCVLMAAMLTVDDTKLTHKAFSDLEPEFATEVISDKFARRPLLMLLVGHMNMRYFAVVQQRFKEINEFKKEFSKKDDDARRQELLTAFLPAINNAVKQHTMEIMKESLGTQFVLELLQNSDAAASDPEVVEAVAQVYDSDPALNKSHVLNVNPFSCRAAKQLCRINPTFRHKLVEYVQQYPAQWATSEGSFAVVALLEALDEQKEDNDVAKLRKALTKHKKEIEKSSAKGKDLLIKLLK